jgi:hypothetical protein
MPGLELHLPAGTVITGEDGTPVTEVGITAIPVDRPPFPLAKNVEVPVYFTIQPGGAYVQTGTPSYVASGLSRTGANGAWLVYPNYRQEYPANGCNFSTTTRTGKTGMCTGSGLSPERGTGEPGSRYAPLQLHRGDD